MELKNKKVLVCGIARSGVAVALMAKKKGAIVTIQDLKKRDLLGDLSELENNEIEIYDGKNPDDIIKNMDLVIVSPGIPTDLPFFSIGESAGVKIISEVEFSYYFTPCPIIAITGTNGKTTTTALTGEIIKKVYPDAAIVGNIGIPYSKEVERLSKNDYVIAEISSFQMEKADTFHPFISAVLNITPDHLDRHKTLGNYIEAKEKVFINATDKDYLVLNYSNDYTKLMSEKTKAKILFFSSQEKLQEGIYLNNDNIIVKCNGISQKLSINDVKILGVHNYENIMAAIAIGICAKIPIEKIFEAVKEFGGVEHRIEFVKTVNGVDYYNDSKATNTDAAIRGIMAMKKPCVLIGGGYDKGSEYDEWVEKFSGKVKHLDLLGATADSIKECCKRHNFSDITKVDTFEEALLLCKDKAESGDCVLLSPACASWEMFDNYEQRGNAFKDIIKKF